MTPKLSAVRPRLAAMLLLLSVGVAGAVAVAVNSSPDKREGTPAAQQPDGTGTVVGARPTSSPSPGGKPSNPGPSGVFSVSGDVTGLVPGAAKTLALTVTNPNPWPIQVLTLDTEVTTPAGSTCPATPIMVGRYTYATGSDLVTAPARGTVRVDVPVTYNDSPDVDQTGCAATTFPLTFSGTAVKTQR